MMNVSTSKVNLKKGIIGLTVLLATVGSFGANTAFAAQMAYVKTETDTYRAAGTVVQVVNYYNTVAIFHGGAYTTSSYTSYYSLVNSIGQSVPCSTTYTTYHY